MFANKGLSVSARHKRQYRLLKILRLCSVEIQRWIYRLWDRTVRYIFPVSGTKDIKRNYELFSMNFFGGCWCVTPLWIDSREIQSEEAVRQSACNSISRHILFREIIGWNRVRMILSPTPNLFSNCGILLRTLYLLLSRQRRKWRNYIHNGSVCEKHFPLPSAFGRKNRLRKWQEKV